MSLPRALIWIISVSLALHLFGLAIVIIVSGPSVLSFGDGVLYLELARNLKDGLGFVSLQTNGLTSEVFRAPGLPLLLEPFVGSVNGLLVYFTLFTTVASVVLPLCTWRIAREFLSDRAAFIAAGIVAFEPVAIFFSWFPFGEIPFLIFTLIAITLFIETSHCERKFSRFVFAAVAGLFAGYAILIRPANAPLFFVGIILAVLLWFKKKEFIIRLIVLCTALFVVLIPWYTHVHAITGTYSLSGNGWRNVYTDYLASLRSVKNVSSYDTERAYLKDKGSKELGLSDRYDLNNPANQALLRQVSIQELTQNVVVVLRLEPMLLLSFFTNDGYYYNAARV
ncbi:MAG: glycosyltransferase family 39 protein, partial [Candidatus Paceibacterota bacterium]